MPPTETIDREQLEQKLSAMPPNNHHPHNGYALINVLSKGRFDREHIPHSINIPLDELGDTDKRFVRDKEIIVYCASWDCDASPRAAAELEKAGFSHVVDYEGGLRDWKEGGNEVIATH
jgi:rhodanese-related sulfurtransferase